MSCNKPLPSPPVAQIVNSASPPKAQRTLVDAEAGTPTDEQWPILRPENVVTPSEPVALSESNAGVRTPQQSVSKDSALRRSSYPLVEMITAPSLSLPFGNRESQSEDTASIYEKFAQMIEPRDFGSMDPAAQSFHAFSTNADVAIDSPLASTQRTSPGLLIPPRVSSKRTLVIPLESSTLEPPEKPASAPFQPVKHAVKQGSTKWPVLGQRSVHTGIENLDGEIASDLEQGLLADQEPVEPVSLDGRSTVPSHYGSIDGGSSSSLAPETSLTNEPETRLKESVRVKRISWYSPNDGSGPILRIFADADAVILGSDDSDHASLAWVQPTSPTDSRTPTPLSTETETRTSNPVKVTPIRSMQPPRDIDTRNLSGRPASTNVQIDSEANKHRDEFASFQTQPCNSLQTSRTTSLSWCRSSIIRQPSMEDHKDGHVRDHIANLQCS